MFYFRLIYFKNLYGSSANFWWEKRTEKKEVTGKSVSSMDKSGLGSGFDTCCPTLCAGGPCSVSASHISIQLFDSVAFTVCLYVPHQWTLYPSSSFSIDLVPLVCQLLVPLLSSFRISFLSVFACHKHFLVSATIELDSIEMEGQHSVSSLEEPKGDESVVAETSCSIPRTGSNNFLSKHRMVAAITLLQNQINFIQVSSHLKCFAQAVNETPSMYCSNML